MEVNKEILEKIRGLLSLSENNSNVNESAAAFKAAQRLLTQHKLSLADIRLADDSEPKEPIEEANQPLTKGIRKITWKGRLANGIAECNGCFVYWDHIRINNRWGRQLKLVGRASDIEVTQFLYHSVATQIEAMCKAALLVYGGGKTFSNNFKKGAVNTVLDRLREAKQEVEQEYEGTHAMVLVNQDKAELDKYEKSLGLNRVKVAKTAYDPNGYAAGVAAGKRVSLARGGLNQSKTKGCLEGN